MGYKLWVYSRYNTTAYLCVRVSEVNTTWRMQEEPPNILYNNSDEPPMTTSYNTIHDAQEAAPLFEVPFPLQTFTAIEYPGPVSTSAHSVEAALDAVGGLKHLSATLAAEEPFKRVVELQLGHGIDRLHPIQGEIVPTQNLVLKITKRRKKRANAGEASVVLPGANKGGYTAEVVGVVDKTVRFRCE